jgi:hypothetical protein
MLFHVLSIDEDGEYMLSKMLSDSEQTIWSYITDDRTIYYYKIKQKFMLKKTEYIENV